MGVLTMGSQGGSSSNGKQSLFQPLTHQNSMYSLTLDEVQNQLGELGKPLGSMNLDELLKTVWTAEATHTELEGTAMADQIALPRQPSLPLTGTLSKKTVDEVWRDIEQSKTTLGEMTLEDFLVKAGIVTEATSEKNDIATQFPQQSQWIQYSQPQRSMVGVYMPGSVMESQVAIPSPLMGKRGLPEGMIEKTVERRQKRMIKNRESAARSRARKQAYTNELENKVSRLEEENERLRRREEMETMLPPPPEPKFQLRRTSSAPF